MSIEIFLEKFRSNGSNTFTHTGWYPTKGTFHVNDEDNDDFLRMYTTYAMKNIEMGLVEQHTKTCPILVDIDIKYELERGLNRCYTKNDVKNIVKLYNEQIEKYFNVDQIDAYVFEKPKPTKKMGNIKDGIHIMYPYIVSESNIQLQMRENVIQLLKTNDLFKHWHAKNKYDDIFDKAVIKSNGWVMYRSTKIGEKPYELSYIIDKQLNEISSLPSLESRPKLFSIRHKPLSPLSDQGILIKNVEKPKLEDVGFNLRTYCSDDDVELAKQLVKILSPSRCDDYGTWIEVGFCLHNIDYNLLDTWIEYSKKSSKYISGECERLWKGFKQQGLSIGSLHRWGKLDDPDNYKKIIDNSLQLVLYESLSCTNYDVAKILYKLYGHVYRCTSTKHSTWYEFCNHRWKEVESGISLKMKISTELASKYRVLQYKYNKQLLNVRDPSEIEKLNKNIKKVEKLMNYVKDTAFKNKIMHECAELFYDSKFYNKLDSQLHLVGFENGVYDLDKLEFRDGRPEDYISFTTYSDYICLSNLKETHAEVYRLIRKILPEDDVYEYIMKVLASCLDGKIRDEKFHIWTGTGANGKSTIIDLFNKSFGDYAGGLPVSLLTQKRAASGAANPELAKTKGKRFICMQEPEEQDKIRVGLMKELTGGDTIQARELYKAPFEFKPQFKMILCCNELPGIDGNDGGTWRRLRVVEYKSTFVDNPDPNVQFQYKKDYSIKDRVFDSDFLQTFISILIDYYIKYKKDGYKIKEPEEVLKYTKDYQKSSNAMNDFNFECLEKTKNKKDALRINTIYRQYTEWYREAYGQKAHSRKDLQKYLDKEYEKTQNGYICVRFRTDSNSDDYLDL